MALLSTNSKPMNLSKDDKTIDNKIDPKINTKDFISILFSQIENHSKESTKEEIKIPVNITPSAKTPIKDEKSKSSNELLLGDILNILTILKGSDDKISFPKFSDKLDKILHDKSVLNEFKNVKNIDDIFKLSKKFNLGLKEIKFTKHDIKTLKKEFPKLDLEKFFETKTLSTNYTADKQTKITKKSKKHIIIEKLVQKLPDSGNYEKPKNILQSLLKDIDRKTKKVVIKNIEEDKKIKVEKYIQKDKISDNKISENKIISKQIKKTPHVLQKEKRETDNTLANTKEIKKPIKKEIIQKKIVKNKEISPNKTTEIGVKEEPIKIEAAANIPEKIIHKTKTAKPTKTQNINNLYTLSTDDKTDTENTNDMKDTKIENGSHKQEFKHGVKIDTFKTDKNIETKNSINQFSNDLKEKIESYKPPIMRVKMALTPKNLGGVEVTLIHRGNNLHVNIVSNTNTMSLFTQNQAEFKNSLVNMGFTNLEMNFSDQGKNSDQNQQNRKNRNSFKEFNNTQNNESAIELIVPRYI